jgi:hypothetical protein
MSPGDALLWAFRLLWGSLAAVVGLQLLSGRINTNGLFHGQRGDGSQYFSPERVQLLMVTVATAAKYASSVMANPHASALPDVPAEWLQLMGGSHAVYLARKAFSMNAGTVAHGTSKKKEG